MPKILCVNYGDYRIKVGHLADVTISEIREVKGVFYAFNEEGKVVYELRAKEVLIEYEPFSINKEKKPTKTDEEKEAFKDSVNYLTQKFINLLEFNHSHFKPPASLVGWEKEFDAMLRIDQWTFEQIKFIMDYAQTDQFWKKIVLSPKKLRDKKDVLMVQAKSKRSEGFNRLQQLASERDDEAGSSETNFTYFE